MTYRTPDDLLDQIANHYAKAHHHLERVGELIAAYRDTIPAPHAEGVGTRRRGQIKSLEAWKEWLRIHHPAYRRTIADSVGNLSANASPHVRKWVPHMEFWHDEQLPPDTLMTISGPRLRGRKGRPEVIYFLWSQRYDLHERYGVGPEPDAERPEPQTVTTTLTGVIAPPSTPTYSWEGAETWPQQTFDYSADLPEPDDDDT